MVDPGKGRKGRAVQVAVPGDSLPTLPLQFPHSADTLMGVVTGGNW